MHLAPGDSPRCPACRPGQGVVEEGKGVPGGGGVAGLCNDGAGHVYPECYMLNSMQTLMYSQTSDSSNGGAHTENSLVLSVGVDGGQSGGGAGGVVVAPSIQQVQPVHWLGRGSEPVCSV